MKYFILAMFLVLLIADSALAQENYKEPQITAQSAILIDQNSGQVLYSKNPFEKRAIASTTKVLTAIIAIESNDLGEIVTVTPKAASVGESTIYLDPQERLTLEDLLYGALLKSGNDACVALAEHTAGNETDFIELMNQKARLLGAKQSSFRNTNGLPNDNHYSTAYDMALVAKYALQNETFAEIVATKYKRIQNNDDSGKTRHLSNTNKLLWDYPWTNGVKTGTTDKAGKCLIGSATKGDRSLIFVLLHSQDRESDGRNLFEYGFNAFENQKLFTKNQKLAEIIVDNGQKERLSVRAEESLLLTVPKKSKADLNRKLNLEFVKQAPIRKGEKLGEYSIYLGDKKLQSIDLIAAEEIRNKSKLEELLTYLKDFK